MEQKRTKTEEGIIIFLLSLIFSSCASLDQSLWFPQRDPNYAITYHSILPQPIMVRYFSREYRPSLMSSGAYGELEMDFRGHYSYALAELDSSNYYYVLIDKNGAELFRGNGNKTRVSKITTEKGYRTTDNGKTYQKYENFYYNSRDTIKIEKEHFFPLILEVHYISGKRYKITISQRRISEDV